MSGSGDERTSAVYDHSHRTDVAHAEIVLPSAVGHGVDLEWALDRSRLWNAAEHAGRQRNSRLAREILVHLPPELTAAQRVQLARGFSRELADRYGGAVDFAVHEPRPRADQRHHHAHLLMTTRQVGPDGLGARTALDLSGTERRARGLGHSKEDLLWIRERWAHLTNEALREAGLTVRVDHRSYRAQGIEREPQPMMPGALYYSERGSGRRHPAAEDIRARYRERVEARAQGPDALARVIERQRRESRERAIETAQRKEGAQRIPQGALTREGLNARRREWSQLHRAEINRKQTERRRANKDEVNRKQREYNQRKTAERRAAKALARLEEPRETIAKERAWPLEQRPQPASPAATSASAEASVKAWLAFRTQQKPAPDQDPLAQWLKYRESGATPDSEHHTRGYSRDPGAPADGQHADPAPDRHLARSRKHDLGL